MLLNNQDPINSTALRFVCRKHLSFPSTLSMDKVSDIEDTIDCQFSDEEEEQLKGVSISGVRDLEDLEVIHLCVNCNKNVTPSTSNIVTCETCNTTQKLSDPKMTANHSQTHTESNRRHPTTNCPSLKLAIPSLDQQWSFTRQWLLKLSSQ